MPPPQVLLQSKIKRLQRLQRKLPQELLLLAKVAIMVDRLGFVPEASWTARVREAVRPVLPMLDPLSREQLQDLWPEPA